MSRCSAFSLVEIDMQNTCEFLLRVHTRVQDNLQLDPNDACHSPRTDRAYA